MPALYVVTHWTQQPWFSTGGTRSKKFIQAPDGNYYYFKKSYKTAGRDYFYEFWSEIVASETGILLGFEMLKYDIAIDGEDMGCISPNMLTSDQEELIEGGKYMQALDSEFEPEIRTTRNHYSFQLVEESLRRFKPGGYIDKVIEIIVFDALIGNSDRHQENWAFINITNSLPPTIKHPETAKFAKLIMQPTKCFSPIYDSGSSLGRELTEEKVKDMLVDDNQFYGYLDRGTSEIHWNNKKLNHFDLVNKLLDTSYAEIVLNTIKRVIEKFDPVILEKIVIEIDTTVPENYAKFKLTEARKHLMIKLITSRFIKLKALHDERV